MDGRSNNEENLKRIKTSKKKYKKRSRSKKNASESVSDSAIRRRRDKSVLKEKRKRRSRSRSRSKSSKSFKRKKNKTRRESRSRSRAKIRKRSRTRSKSGSLKEKKSGKIESKIDLSKSKFSNFTEPSAEEIDQVPATTTGPQSVQALALAQAAKVDRKLYIGNLPTGITPASLVQLLNTALITLKANTKPGDPVLSAWISTDGHYAFVEFRTAEEANNGFLLNTISILGQPLKVGRPKTYTGTLSMMEDGSLPNTVAAALQAGTMNAPQEGKKIQFPTKIICFHDIVKDINLENDEEYNDTLLDIKEECSKYGRVNSVFIPRKDVEDNPTSGMGNAFVEFFTIEEAKEARKQMTGRKFNKKTVNIKFTSEEAYNSKEFELVKN